MVMACLVVTGAYGLNTNTTLAYQAFTFLLAVLFLALVMSLYFKPSIKAERRLPRFGTVGEPLTYLVRIDNNGARRQRGIELFEDIKIDLPGFEDFIAARDPEEENRNSFDRMVGYYRWRRLVDRGKDKWIKRSALPDISAGDSIEIRMEMNPSKRGPVHLSGMSFARPDPLGLFRSMFKHPLADTVLILPKRYGIPPANLPGNRKYQPGGVALASSVGDSEEFVSMREYRPGDPLRKIHWKSWAKTGKPIVKEYQDEFFVRHALVLDTFLDRGNQEMFEEAVSVAASYTCSVLTQESLLDLMFVGPQAYCFTSGRGLAHTDRMLEILACVDVCREKPFSEIKPLILERAPLLSACICILLSWDDERRDLVRNLKELGLPIKVVVIKDADDESVLTPGPMADDVLNFHQLQCGKVEEVMAGT